MRAPTSCAKCGGSLSTGFLVDEGYGTSHASTWQEGEPKKVWYGGVKMVKGSQMKVTSFRCDRCGYLESYALNA